VVVAVLTASVAGCSAGGVDGPVLTSGRGGGGEASAQVQGTIVLDGGCLLLEREGIRYPVVWPRGTRWQPQPPAVVLSTGTVPVGGAVLGGGGYVQAKWLSSLPDDVVEAARACAGATGEVAVFNPGSEITITSE
jgi:hypothetical protein